MAGVAFAHITDNRPLILRAVWHLTADDPEGDVTILGNWADLSVQAEGEFGSGQVVFLQSNSGEAYEETAVLAYPTHERLRPGVYGKPRLVLADANSRVTVTVGGWR